MNSKKKITYRISKGLIEEELISTLKSYKDGYTDMSIEMDKEELSFSLKGIKV